MKYFSSLKILLTSITLLAFSNSYAEISQSAEIDYSEGIKSFQQSPNAVDLAMNGVPVLDTKGYGSSITFATTAVLDALIQKGDFIDQQCTLAHNKYIGYDYWDGAYMASIMQIIDFFKEYGIVKKGNCNATYPAPNVRITTENYKKLTDKTVNIDAVKYKYLEQLTLDNVRSTLDSGKRIVLGFQWKATDVLSVQGFDITVDGKKHQGGLWACNQPSGAKNYCGDAYSGYAAILIGYDDAQRLFKLRNSWGNEFGDNGDYYMTYEFFTAMALDGVEVGF